MALCMYSLYIVHICTIYIQTAIMLALQMGLRQKKKNYVIKCNSVYDYEF